MAGMTKTLAEVFKDAIAAMKAGQLDRALSRLNLVIDRLPAWTPAYIQRGTVYSDMGRWDLAKADWERALELEPGNADFKWILSMLDLQLGNLLRGWELYESRWQSRAFRSPRLRTDLPVWSPGKGYRSVLVWFEQGIGDQILYASLLGAVKACTERVTARIDARLVQLFKRADPSVEFIAHDAEPDLSRFDAQIPLASLPGHFIDSPKKLARHCSRQYLKPSARRVDELRQELCLEPDDLVIGLCWASTSPAIGSKKSVRLEELQALWNLPRMKALSLQFGEPALEVGPFQHGTGLTVCTPNLDTTSDLEGVAAALALCDALVTVSNSNAHIAGAMGVPTYLLDARHAWYWSHTAGRQSLWYPTVRIYARDRALAPWTHPIQELVQDLRAAVSGPTARLGRRV
jgi:tetratricopeptide (TPR) repeat protein